MVAAPITYVRHAMPAVEDGVDPADWHLGEDTRAQVRGWADRLEVGERIAVLVASTEPKAIETATAIAGRWPAEVRQDERLREARRPWIGTGYRHLAHRYLRGEPLDGWEPHEAVAERMAAAVDDALTSAAHGPVVIVGHGLALSIHLGDRLGPDFDRESFWSRLAFPDAWALVAGELHRSLPTPAV